jgi:hypothetical protein
LNNLKATTQKQRQDGLNASAALIRDLQARADRGEVEYVALFGNIINTKSVQKATTQAFNDVKNSTSSQFLRGSSRDAHTIVNQNNRILMGVVWSEVKLLETGARFPELASADVTCKTNREGRPLLKIQGVDGNGKMYTRANALLWNESHVAFLFVFKTAVPQLWGESVCEATSLFLTDGDPQMISALRGVRLSSALPNITLKRCFWHLIHREFTKMFGNGEHDLETNKVVRGWFNSLAYRVETPADFTQSMEALKAWIVANVGDTLMPLIQEKRRGADFSDGTNASVCLKRGGSKDILGKVLQNGSMRLGSYHHSTV